MIIIDGDLGTFTNGFKGSTENDTPNLVGSRVGVKDFTNLIFATEVATEDINFAVIFFLLGGSGGELVDGNLLKTFDGGGESVVVVVEDCWRRSASS